MTTDGQPLPTARLARGGDFTPDPALYPFASRWLASSAGAMHYSDEGSGPAILFCHGNPTSSSLYRGIIERLRGRFRCVAAEVHCFGLSERPATGAGGRRLVRGYAAERHGDRPLPRAIEIVSRVRPERAGSSGVVVDSPARHQGSPAVHHTRALRSTPAPDAPAGPLPARFRGLRRDADGETRRTRQVAPLPSHHCEHRGAADQHRARPRGSLKTGRPVAGRA